MNRSNFRARTITGLSMVFLILLALWINIWAFAVIVFAVIVLGLSEFYSLVGINSIKPQRFFGITASVVWYVASVFIAYLGDLFDVLYLIVLPIPFLFLPFVIEIFTGREHPLQNVAVTLLGMIYIAMPLSFLPLMAGKGTATLLGMPAFLLGYLIITWVFDTGAYLIGSAFGKTKLFERISPKKTWEGLAGGVLFAMLVTAGLYLVVDSVSWTDWGVLLLIVLVFGTFGDLIESLFKRSLKIKDSGTILPGHGGILDRFDTILISAPFVFLYFFLRSGI